MHLIDGPLLPGVISEIIAKSGENHECGAHSLFLGQVRRDQTEGKYVKSGEISLLVMVSAGHRDHASKACAKAVELIKEKLPIWKKEVFEDESGQWKQNE